MMQLDIEFIHPTSDHIVAFLAVYSTNQSYCEVVWIICQSDKSSTYRCGWGEYVSCMIRHRR